MNEMNHLTSIAGRAIVNVSFGFISRSMKFQKPIPITFPRETQGRLRKLFISTLIILYQNGEDFRRRRMGKYHNIERVSFDKDTLLLQVDGNEYRFDLKEHSQKLLNANETERNNYEISPSGYGIHWPIIDEDLSIDGLLGIKHSIHYEERAGKK
jgi:hypothetical protein